MTAPAPNIAMDTSAYNALMNELTDPATKRLSPTKIMALPPDVKAAAVTYMAGLKRPIIALFVSIEDKDRLLAAGYQPGFHNEFFPYWVRPEQAQYFTKSEPEPAPPAPVVDTPPAPAPKSRGVGKAIQKQRNIKDPDAISEDAILKMIGETIERQRKKLNWTGEMVGDLIGVDRGLISKYESGSYSMRVQRFYELIEALGGKVVITFDEPAK